MEGYKGNDATCTKAVQSFVTAWHERAARARVTCSGVYGSAASTIRDVAALGPAKPDDAWIANWNGVEGVFGDPYVSDALWPNHQRVHQYKGGHKETYGGVTINIDSQLRRRRRRRRQRRRAASAAARRAAGRLGRLRRRQGDRDLARRLVRHRRRS